MRGRSTMTARLMSFSLLSLKRSTVSTTSLYLCVNVLMHKMSVSLCPLVHAVLEAQHCLHNLFVSVRMCMHKHKCFKRRACHDCTSDELLFAVL